MKALEKALEVSSWAAFMVGPKQGMPAAASRSANPASSAVSGPTTTRSAFISRATAHRPSASVTFSATRSPSLSMPGLPGAMTSRRTRGDWAIFHARACSRPPDPTSRMFIPAQ